MQHETALCRTRCQPRVTRWITNRVITLLDTGMPGARAPGLPLLAVGAAVDAAANGRGLLNRVDWPVRIEITGAVLVFDFAIWARRPVAQKVVILWRLHRSHRADRNIGVRTAIRFHPAGTGPQWRDDSPSRPGWSLALPFARK